MFNELFREASASTNQVPSAADVKAFFGSTEAAHRAFAEYLVTGDAFDLPKEWGIDSFGLVERYGNSGMIHALLLAELVRKSRGKRARKAKGAK